MGVPSGDGPLPKIALKKHGLVTAVDPAKKVGALAPNDLDTAFEDLFATGGKKEGKDLASTKPAKESIGYYEKRNSGELATQATVRYFRVQPKYQKVYAMKTADGSVAAIFGTAHTIETLLKPAYMSAADLVPGGKQAVSTPVKAEDHHRRVPGPGTGRDARHRQGAVRERRKNSVHTEPRSPIRLAHCSRPGSAPAPASRPPTSSVKPSWWSGACARISTGKQPSLRKPKMPWPTTPKLAPRSSR
ncbi:hypothetical protein ABZ408_39760 [Streptomyces tibetensis]|uniref:hypothetical protein n=1 Tax=Streptomyces tibetensis TaxID=2382123 RepID=UPI0033C0DCA2